jgi:hypothetical protein
MRRLGNEALVALREQPADAHHLDHARLGGRGEERVRP